MDDNTEKAIKRLMASNKNWTYDMALFELNRWS